MTRPLKFRFLDSRTNKFVYSNEFEWQKETQQLRAFFVMAENFAKNDVIQQYIGLTDKNGKEIYEGDIVKQCLYLYDEWVGNDLYGCIMHRIVEMASYTENQTNRNVGFALFPDINYKDWSGHPITSKCEIVGNIFETPELLDKNKLWTKPPSRDKNNS